MRQMGRVPRAGFRLPRYFLKLTNRQSSIGKNAAVPVQQTAEIVVNIPSISESEVTAQDGRNVRSPLFQTRESVNQDGGGQCSDPGCTPLLLGSLSGL